MELSIVLPAYNEAQSLADLVDRFRAIQANYSWELILVDNGSTDSTRQVISSCSQQPDTAFLNPLLLPHNLGYGGGILAGLHAAKGEFLAWSHADKQTPPEDLFAAFELLRKAPSPTSTLVKGSRGRRPLSQQALTLGMQAAASLLLRQPLRDINAQPKVFHRGLLDHFRNPPEDFNLDLYVYHLALSLRWHVFTLPVEFGLREHGQSRWAFSLRSKTRHILKTLRFIAQLSTHPKPRKDRP